MNKKFLLLTAALFALFSACSDNVVLQEPQPLPVFPDLPANIAVETTAKLSVLVTDTVTGAPLDAEVTLLSSTGVPITVDAVAGIAEFDSLHVGSYNLIIKMAGYAGEVAATRISLADSATENIFIAQDRALQVRLAPLTAGLSGYLFYEDSSGNRHPAEGATVRIQFSDDFLTKVYPATVIGGKYEFIGLPAVGTNYKIYGLAYTVPIPNGVTYKTIDIQPKELIHDVMAYADKEETYFMNDHGVSLFTLLSYRNSVNYADTVIFEFSDNIDIQKLSYNMVSLTENQVANIIWKGTKLYLVPVGGKWTSSFEVEFQKDIKSIGGKTLAYSDLGSKSIHVNAPDLSGTLITGLRNLDSSDINFNSMGVTLRWNKVANATGFIIYAKVNNGLNLWREIDEFVPSPGGDDTTKAVSLFGTYPLGLDPFENGGEVKFVVQAYNSSSRTLIDTARAITVYDRVGPSLNPLFYAPIAGDEAILFGSDDFINELTSYLSQIGQIPNARTYRVTFSEPMNFALATGIFSSDPLGRLSMAIKPVPNDEYSLDLTLNIAGGPILSAALLENINTYYTLSGLRDKRGNPLNFEYYWVSPNKRDILNFRFRTNYPF